ncbi:MAG TPA: carboxypeptidase regulatory-like domain-containing protein, partial [Kofleriaceae bacterium]|nr:carboxypeptidase regulatory-like domain-containing protein [Kofleriaceae bacterium]
MKHALDELRDRLRARADGPKQGWLAALVPLAKVRPEPALAVGALAMKKVIAVVAGILLLLLAGGVAWRAARHGEGTAGEVDPRGTSQAGLTWSALTTPRTSIQVALPGWFAQAGAPNRRVAGRVIFDGTPVAAAVVRLGVIATNTHVQVPAMTPGPPFTEVAMRVTDAHGMFDFGALPAAMFVISAEADGKAPVSVGIAVADPKLPVDHLVLALGACGTRVTGTVRDTSSPIARARLKVAGLAGIKTDDKGRFALCMPAAKYPNIRVEADGYGSVNVQVPAMYGEIHRDFVLVPEAEIEGVVVDEAGVAAGGAAVGAWPALTDAQDEASAVRTIADGQGRFRIAGLAPTKYGLGASGEQGESIDHPLVVAAAGTVTRGVKLVVAKHARLRGHVVMAGAPVEGARVGIEHTGGSVAISQADGSFTLDGVRLGRAPLVASPYEVVTPTAFEVRGDVDNLVIEVAAKASVRGRVTRHGQPVTNARVELLPGHEMTTADNDGSYVLEGLAAGNFDLYASTPLAFTNHPVILVAGQAQTIDLELESGGEVLGTVVDRAGAPVSGVLVRLRSPGDGDECHSFTDARGGFDCATLAGHRDYKVGVFPDASEAAGYAPATGGSFPAIHVDDGDTVVRDVQLAIVHDEL